MNKRYNALPPELRALPQWVCWGIYADRPKMPVNPTTGKPARAGDPSTWSSFETAACYKAAGRCKGIGFEFNNNGIVGVDFDHCLKDGKLTPFAAKWVKALDSYTEISPSGTGVHVLVKGKLPGPAVKRPECELYEQGRYFTVTARPFGPVRPLRKAQNALDALYKDLAPAGSVATVDTPGPRSAVPTGKDYLQTGLERDPTFADLWNGSRPHGNESSDDQALMNKLAYWCSCDAERMQAAFLASPHSQGKDPQHRRKLQRKDYLARTVAAAVQNCSRTAAAADADYQARRVQRQDAGHPLDWSGAPEYPTGDAFGRSEYQEAKKEAAPFLSPASGFESRTPDYFFNPYLPRGMIAIMGGESGSGKTWLALSWAAAISKGEKLPFQDPFEERPGPGYVYYFTAENDPNYIIAPRLRTLQADMDRIFLQPMGATAKMNDPRLEETAVQYPPAMIVFDPIQSYLGNGVDMYRPNEVRPILDWLGGFASNHKCAVVLISHVGKPGQAPVSALDRLLGSSDFRNAARSIVMVGYDPDDETKRTRVFAHGKNSIGELGESQKFHIDSVAGIVYDGECSLTVNEIVKQSQPQARSKPAATLTGARKALEELLGPEGYATLEQVETLQAALGCSAGTFSSARKELAIQSVSIGKPPNRQTWWLLPEVDKAQFKRDHEPPPEQLALEHFNESE